MRFVVYQNQLSSCYHICSTNCTNTEFIISHTSFINTWGQWLIICKTIQTICSKHKPVERHKLYWRNRRICRQLFFECGSEGGLRRFYQAISALLPASGCFSLARLYLGPHSKRNPGMNISKPSDFMRTGLNLDTFHAPLFKDILLPRQS